MTKKKIVLLFLGALAVVGCWILPVPHGLSPQAMQALGILACGVLWMSGDVLPDYAVALLTLTAWVLFGLLPFPIAFSAFSNTSFWLLLGAMVIGVAGSKSGLLLRIALTVLKIFPADFRGQCLAMMTSGLIISPLVPSTVAKVAIMGPAVKQISDSMGYEDESKGSAGLFGAYYAGFAVFGNIFLSGSVIAYAMVGALPEHYHNIGWLQWLYWAMPWAISIIVLTYAGLMLFYRPKRDKKIDLTEIKQMSADLGPMSRDERVTAGVVIACLALWVSESFAGINSTAVAILGMIVLIVTGVVNGSDFNKKIPWNLVFFIGAVMSISSMMTYLKIDTWAGPVCGRLLAPLTANPYLFVLALVAVILVIRLLIASSTSTTTIFTIVVVPLTMAAGYFPWVVGFIIYCTAHVWFLPYQMPLFLTAKAAAGNGVMINQRQAAFQCLICTIASTVGLLLCVPWWQMLGLMP